MRGKLGISVKDPMYVKKICEKIEEAHGLVVVAITVACGCGDFVQFDDTRLCIGSFKVATKGWTFNPGGTGAMCPGCTKRIKNASVSDSPSIVRRLSKEAGKQPQKEVRKPRRVRGR